MSNENKLSNPIPNLWHMKCEEARLMTYISWPSNIGVSPKDLAKAGFFYKGSKDSVQCPFCELILYKWEPKDKPIYEHQKYLPKCEFVLGSDVGNISIKPEDYQRIQVHKHFVIVNK